MKIASNENFKVEKGRNHGWNFLFPDVSCQMDNQEMKILPAFQDLPESKWFAGHIEGLGSCRLKTDTSRLLTKLLNLNIMKTLLALVGVCLLTFNLNAQVSEPITIDDKGHYTQHDVRLNVKTILNIVEPNIVAYQEVKRGKSRRTWGYVLSFSAGAFTSMAILEEEDRGIAIAAACLSFGGGVILLTSGLRHIAMGVNIYNKSLSSSSTSNSGSINLGFSKNGVGLTFTF